jgi:RNA polymerase sigma-70 factor (ECF subfamily)
VPPTDFASFFREVYPQVVRALFLAVADLAEAEDLAQEAMARVYERWTRVRGMESPSGYLYRTAINLRRSRLRALTRRRIFSRNVETADFEDRLGERVDLERALRALPPGQREAISLIDVLGLSTEEAANVLGIAPASVRSRVHRARTAMRGLLEGKR